MHDFDERLPGSKALRDFGADRPLFDRLGECPDDTERDIRIEQREADLADRIVDIVLGEPSPAGHGLQCGRETGSEAVEHGPVL